MVMLPMLLIGLHILHLFMYYLTQNIANHFIIISTLISLSICLKKIWNSMVKIMRFFKVCAWQNLSRNFYIQFLCYVFFCSSSIAKTKRKNVYCLSVVIAPHSTLKSHHHHYHDQPHKINKLLAVVKRYQMCTNEAILIEFIPSCNMQKRHLYSNQYFLAHKRLQNSSIFKHKFLKFPFSAKFISAHMVFKLWRILSINFMYGIIKEV